VRLIKTKISKACYKLSSLLRCLSASGIAEGRISRESRLEDSIYGVERRRRNTEAHSKAEYFACV